MTTATVPLPRTPVVLDRVVDDPADVHRLIEAHQPYWPVQRYFANSAEYAALSGDPEPAEMIIAPVFRGNWAIDGEPLEGVRPILESERFIEAAKQLFGAEIIRPTTVYVNLTWQLPFPQGAGHTDVPAFRGFDRTTQPITFLTIMGLSGLFEDVRVKVATGVSWFYRGEGGGFEYWPSGPDAGSVVHEGAIDNTAIVADNDFMWHRVRPTGRVEDGMVTLTRDAELVHRGGGDWAIVDGGEQKAAFGFDAVRVSLSWKGIAFDGEADRRRHDEHTDDIDLAEVLRRFTADLADRGITVDPPADPVRDPAFVRTLRDAYVRYPAT
ncbi:MAG TPA: hypothetical protein VG708_07310 [Mycobacteriales bacterium]|nr:hypothetical protein [Mycobacteriales bacterium]